MISFDIKMIQNDNKNVNVPDKTNNNFSFISDDTKREYLIRPISLSLSCNIINNLHSILTFDQF